MINEQIYFLFFLLINSSTNSGGRATTALNPSGVDVKVSHTWSKKGDYTIKAHAQDECGSNGLDATFSVKMPRNRASHGSLFFRFLEQFPILERLLFSLR